MAKQRNNYFSRNRNPYQRRSWLWYLKALRKWEDKFMFLLQLVSLLAKWKFKKSAKVLLGPFCVCACVCSWQHPWADSSQVKSIDHWVITCSEANLPEFFSSVKVWRIPSCFYKEFLFWWHKASQQRKLGSSQPTKPHTSRVRTSAAAFPPRLSWEKQAIPYHCSFTLLNPFSQCFKVDASAVNIAPGACARNN